jgi:hypothetical protein
MNKRKSTLQEEFEDNKWVITFGKSKKDTTQKAKD